MTGEDLEKFIAYLSSRSIDFAGWYDKLPKLGPRGYENVKAELRRIFERTMLQDAVELIDAIVGTEDEPNYGSGWVKVLRRRLRMRVDAKPRRLHALPDDPDGNETFACRWCQDTGTVLCVHLQSLAAARADDEDFKPGAAVSAAYGCTCDANQNRERPEYRAGACILWRDFVEGIRRQRRTLDALRDYLATLDPITARGGSEWNPDEWEAV